jgi:hypothetical protein
VVQLLATILLQQLRLLQHVTIITLLVGQQKYLLRPEDFTVLKVVVLPKRIQVLGSLVLLILLVNTIYKNHPKGCFLFGEGIYFLVYE